MLSDHKNKKYTCAIHTPLPPYASTYIPPCSQTREIDREKQCNCSTRLRTLGLSSDRPPPGWIRSMSRVPWSRILALCAPIVQVRLPSNRPFATRAPSARRLRVGTFPTVCRPTLSWRPRRCSFRAHSPSRPRVQTLSTDRWISCDIPARIWRTRWSTPMTSTRTNRCSKPTFAEH